MLRSGHLAAMHELSIQEELLSQENLVQATFKFANNYLTAMMSNKPPQPLKTTTKALIEVLRMLRQLNYSSSTACVLTGVSYAIDRKITRYFPSGSTAEAEPAFIISPIDLQQWYLGTFPSVDLNTDLEFQLFFFFLYLNNRSERNFYYADVNQHFSKEFISDCLIQMGERLGNSIDEALKVINSHSDAIAGNILCEVAQKKFNLSDEEKESLKKKNRLITHRRKMFNVAYEQTHPELGQDCFEIVVYERSGGPAAAAKSYLRIINLNQDANDVQFALERIYKLMTHQSVLEEILRLESNVGAESSITPLINVAIDSYQAIIDTHFAACIESPHTELEEKFNGHNLEEMHRLITLGQSNLWSREYGKGQSDPKIGEAITILHRMTYSEDQEVSLSQYEASKLVFPRLTEQMYKTYRQRYAIKNYRQRVYGLVCAFQKELFETKFTILYGTYIYADPTHVKALKELFEGDQYSTSFSTANSLFPLILTALRAAMQATSARTSETAAFYEKWLVKFEDISFLEIKNPTNTSWEYQLSGRVAIIRIMAKNQQAFDLTVKPSEVIEALDWLATEADSTAIEFLITNLGYTAVNKEKIVDAYFQLSAENLAAFYLDKFKNTTGTDGADLEVYFYTFKNYLLCYAAVSATKHHLTNLLSHVSKLFANQLSQNIKKLEGRLGDTIQDALRYIAQFDDEVLIKFHLACAVKKFNLTDAEVERQYTQYKNITRRMVSFGINYERASSKLTDEYLLAYAFQWGLDRPTDLTLAAQRYLNVIRDKENAESVTQAIDRLVEILPGDNAVCSKVLDFYVNTVDFDSRERALLSSAVDKYQELINGYFKTISNSATSEPTGTHYLLNNLITMQTLIVAAQRVLCLTAIDSHNPLIKGALTTLHRLINLDGTVNPELIQQAEQAIPGLTQQVVATYRQRVIVNNYHDRMRALIKVFKHDLYTQHFDIAYAGVYISGDPKAIHAFKEIVDAMDLNDEQSVRSNFPKIVERLKVTQEGNSYRTPATDKFYSKWITKFDDLQFVYQGLNPDLIILAEVENLNLSDLRLVWKQERNVSLKIKLACGIRLFKLDPNFKQEFIEAVKTFPLLECNTTFTSSGFGLFGNFSQVPDAAYSCIYAIAYANAMLNTNTDLSIIKETVKICFIPSMTRALSTLPNFLAKTFLNILLRGRYWPADIELPQTGAELEKTKELYKQLIVGADPFDFDLAFQSLCQRTVLGKLFDKANGALATSLEKGTKHAILEAIAANLSQRNCSGLLLTTRHNIRLEFHQDPHALKYLQEKYPAVFKVIDETIRMELDRKKAKAPAPRAETDVLESGDPRAKSTISYDL